MSRKWPGGAIVLGVLGVAALASADAPLISPEAAFGSKTELATLTSSAIKSRVADIEQLLTLANQEGKAIKASCIDEKLRRARHNQDAAATVMTGWAIGQNNPEYAQRQLDRLLLLQVYSIVYTEEARACADAKAAGQSLQVEILKVLPELPKPDITRAPRFDRPPLASPY